jgi:hypothetical protein
MVSRNAKRHLPQHLAQVRLARLMFRIYLANFTVWSLVLIVLFAKNPLAYFTENSKSIVYPSID